MPYADKQEAAASNKRYREENAERLADIKREWRDANRDKVRVYNNSSNKKLRLVAPEVAHTRDRKDHLSRYGLTQEQYDAILDAQGHRCAICRRHESEFKRRLYIDHDHKCCPSKARSCGLCVRGLLCHTCNTLLGNVNDDIAMLDKARLYLISR